MTTRAKKLDGCDFWAVNGAILPVAFIHGNEQAILVIEIDT